MGKHDFRVDPKHVRTGWEDPEGLWIFVYRCRFTHEEKTVINGGHIGQLALKIAWGAEGLEVLARPGCGISTAGISMGMVTDVPYAHRVNLTLEGEVRTPTFLSMREFEKWLDCGTISVYAAATNEYGERFSMALRKPGIDPENVVVEP